MSPSGTSVTSPQAANRSSRSGTNGCQRLAPLCPAASRAPGRPRPGRPRVESGGAVAAAARPTVSAPRATDGSPPPPRPAALLRPIGPPLAFPLRGHVLANAGRRHGYLLVLGNRTYEAPIPGNRSFAVTRALVTGDYGRYATGVRFSPRLTGATRSSPMAASGRAGIHGTICGARPKMWAWDNRRCRIPLRMALRRVQRPARVPRHVAQQTDNGAGRTRCSIDDRRWRPSSLG